MEHDSRPVIEIYGSMECPYAYLATYRLRQVWPEFRSQVRLVWRALSLEYINRQSYPMPLHLAEHSLFQQIEPDLPWKRWSRAEWEWPSTHWPGFEALACAQAQGDAAALEMSWALRYAYFAGNRSVSLRHEIMDIASQLGEQGVLDMERFERGWDSGRYKLQVLEESRRGWHEIRLEGSATLILPDGSRVTNPFVGEIDFDEQNFVLRSYKPYPGDPQQAYREMILRSLEKARG